LHDAHRLVTVESRYPQGYRKYPGRRPAKEASNGQFPVPHRVLIVGGGTRERRDTWLLKRYGLPGLT